LTARTPAGPGSLSPIGALALAFAVVFEAPTPENAQAARLLAADMGQDFTTDEIDRAIAVAAAVLTETALILP